MAKRELPVMPSMGGTGKIEAPGQGPMAEKIREKKRKHKLRQVLGWPCVRFIYSAESLLRRAKALAECQALACR